MKNTHDYANTSLHVKFLSASGNNAGKYLTWYKSGSYINNTSIIRDSDRDINNIPLGYTCQQSMLKSTLYYGKWTWKDSIECYVINTYLNHSHTFIKLYIITMLGNSIIFVLLNLWFVYLNLNFDITSLYVGNSNVESPQESNSISESALHHTESFIEKYFGMLCFWKFKQYELGIIQSITYEINIENKQTFMEKFFKMLYFNKLEAFPMHSLSCDNIIPQKLNYSDPVDHSIILKKLKLSNDADHSIILKKLKYNDSVNNINLCQKLREIFYNTAEYRDGIPHFECNPRDKFLYACKSSLGYRVTKGLTHTGIMDINCPPEAIDKNARANFLALAESIHTNAIELSKLPELKDMYDEKQMRIMWLHAGIDTFKGAIEHVWHNINASHMYIKTLNSTLSNLKAQRDAAEHQIAFCAEMVGTPSLDQITELDGEVAYLTNKAVTVRLQQLDTEILIMETSFDAKKLSTELNEERDQYRLDLEIFKTSLAADLKRTYEKLGSNLTTSMRHEINYVVAKRVTEGQLNIFDEHIRNFTNLISEEEAVVEKYYEKCARANVDLSMFKRAIEDCEHIK